MLVVEFVWLNARNAAQVDQTVGAIEETTSLANASGAPYRLADVAHLKERQVFFYRDGPRLLSAKRSRQFRRRDARISVKEISVPWKHQSLPCPRDRGLAHSKAAESNIHNLRARLGEFICYVN